MTKEHYETTFDVCFYEFDTLLQSMEFTGNKSLPYCSHCQCWIALTDQYVWVASHLKDTPDDYNLHRRCVDAFFNSHN